MANIAKMNVQLTAGVQGFIVGMRKAGDSVERFAKKANAQLGGRFNSAISGLSRGISKIGGPLSMGLAKLGGIASSAFKGIAVGAAGAAAGLGYLSLSMIEAIGDSADMAKRLGISYNALKTFQYAAKLAGVDAEALNKAFEKMQDTFGAALMGNKAAIEVFNQLGLSMAALSQMSPEQRFKAIGEAIARIPDPAQRLAAARDVFGKQGGALLVLFNDIAASLADAAEQMDRLGVSLSALDVSNAEAAGDAIDNFKTTIEGIATQISTYLSPYIVKLWDDTQKWIDAMGGIPAIVDGGMMQLENALGWIADKTDWLVVGWEKLTTLWGLVPDWVKEGGAAGWAVRGIKEWIAMDVEERQQKRGKPSGKLAQWAQQAQAESDARAAQQTQDNEAARINEESAMVNRDAVEAAKQRQREEMWNSYVSKFGDPAADQQRAAEIMERARARGVVPSGPLAQANRTPFVGQSAQGGGIGEQVMLLRQIASNTGKPTLAYAG